MTELDKILIEYIPKSIKLHNKFFNKKFKIWTNYYKYLSIIDEQLTMTYNYINNDGEKWDIIFIYIDFLKSFKKIVSKLYEVSLGNKGSYPFNEYSSDVEDLEINQYALIKELSEWKSVS